MHTLFELTISLAFKNLTKALVFFPFLCVLLKYLIFNVFNSNLQGHDQTKRRKCRGCEENWLTCELRMPYIYYRVQFLLHRIRFQNINLYAFTAYYMSIFVIDQLNKIHQSKNITLGSQLVWCLGPNSGPLVPRVKMDSFVHFLDVLGLFQPQITAHPA